MAEIGEFAVEWAVAARAARGAATAILAERRHPTVSIKPDGTPVTSADLAADAAIRAAIHEVFPGDAILSEEVADDRARLSSDRCWIVDPLDGTSYFVAGGDDFDTFVALAVDGVPAVAVALQPATGVLLGAVAGQGAWRQVGDGPRELLAVSARPRRRLATKSWLGAPANLATLEEVAGRVNGSLVHASFSLCPRCFAPPQASVDALVGFPAAGPIDAWEWDVAAVDLIVREGGGASSDLTGAPLRYNKADPRFARGLIVAADSALHRDLLGALRGSGGEAGAGTNPAP